MLFSYFFVRASSVKGSALPRDLTAVSTAGSALPRDLPAVSTAGSVLPRDLPAVSTAHVSTTLSAPHFLLIPALSGSSGWGRPLFI